MTSASDLDKQQTDIYQWVKHSGGWREIAALGFLLQKSHANVE